MKTTLAVSRATLRHQDPARGFGLAQASDSRTPISYLIRPITFYFDRAFRDG